ncbi:S41 family peptidase [Spirosoma rigui]|uniref:S41 family peptidase n=1 Tax=Spirosoma rigui TaxID=564064 RepID=UPI0009B13A33|nr:S41 family peptidase [Spirosoma rigui]
MRFLLLFPGLWLWTNSLQAQGSTDSCRCTQVFNQVHQKAAANYAGWADKVNVNTRPAFTRLVDSLQILARVTTSDTGCMTLLKRYKAFFRDGHFQVSLRASGKGTTSPVRKIPVVEADVRQQLLKRAGHRKPIEGIWETPDHSYTIAVVPDPQRADALVGVVLSATNPAWTPGSVKMELLPGSGNSINTLYRNAAFEVERVQLTQQGNFFDISGYGTWIRTFPETITAAERQAYEQAQSPLEFRQINPGVAYLRVSNFNVPKAEVDSLVKAHQAALARSPLLIIDIRNNFGGSNSSFSALLPLMNTNNFQDTHSYMRTSPDNIAAEEAMVARARAGKWDVDSVLNAWARDVARAKQHPDQLYRTEGELIRIDSVLPYPARVAVLINDKCYSSAEYFAFYAKQSRKTQLFGQHTGGVMDYGNVRNQTMDCSQFILRLPTTRSGWVDTSPVDNRGFQPDVPISATEPDWVAFVVNYYKQTPTSSTR